MSKETSASGQSLSILMLSRDFYPRTSGGAFTDWEFAKYAAEEGHNVVVYADRLPDTPKQEVVQDVEIHRPYRMSPVDSHANSPYGQIRRILTGLLLGLHLLAVNLHRNFDVIYSTNHVMHPPSKVIGTVFQLPIVNFIGYSPSIVGKNSTKPNSIFIFEQIIFRYFLGDSVLCRTPGIVDQIKKYSDVDISTIHGVVNGEKIRGLAKEPKTRENQSEKHLIFVGRLEGLKNPTGAVEILSELPKEYHLTIVGDGQERSEVEDKISELGVSDRVIMTGLLSHEAALKQIASADGLLLTSYTEAYPTVVFEALTLGTPVFATPVGILVDISEEQLHISDIDTLPTTIEHTVESDPAELEKLLDKYDITRFCEDALSKICEEINNGKV